MRSHFVFFDGFSVHQYRLQFSIKDSFSVRVEGQP